MRLVGSSCLVKENLLAGFGNSGEHG
jgi:hypothetical protein